jgi:hypothetical protein
MMIKLPFHILVFLSVPVLIFILSCKGPGFDIEIKADSQEVFMGQNVALHAKFTPEKGEGPLDYILLPFVEGKRWGAFEFPDEDGEASFLIPLPNIGYPDIEVVAVKRTNDSWRGLDDITLLRTGTPMPPDGIVSEKIEVRVKQKLYSSKKPGKSVFAMQWEPWFIPNWSWSTAQAVPLMGFYDCTNPDVLRQQMLWMIDMGIDCLVVDWSNHIWGADHWTERGGGADQIIHVTQILLEVLADMRDEGLPVPTVALMPGLSNGPPATMLALNEQLEWIFQDYVRNPRFKGLWQMWDGKPLIIILDTGVMATKEGSTESAFRVPFFKQTLTMNGATEASLDEMRQKQDPVDDTHFTVRWMSSQNQLTGHDKLGYWSWMDGSLLPLTTYRDGRAEAITVCTAVFPETGWKAEGAYGKRNGWTYLKSFQEAQRTEPAFIMLHQYMEYAGQQEGNAYGPDKDIYVDSYSCDLSDDIEPVSLTAPGYRGDQGGWGYYYHNLTKAMIKVYNGEISDATVLAVSPPRVGSQKILFEWTTIGPQAQDYNLYIDGVLLAEKIKADSYTVNLADIEKGDHVVKVAANNVSTRFDLSEYKMDELLSEAIPVAREIQFTIK